MKTLSFAHLFVKKIWDDPNEDDLPCDLKSDGDADQNLFLQNLLTYLAKRDGAWPHLGAGDDGGRLLCETPYVRVLLPFAPDDAGERKTQALWTLARQQLREHLLHNCLL